MRDWTKPVYFAVGQEEKIVEPRDKKKFTYEELHEMIGGFVNHFLLRPGVFLLINDEAQQGNLEFNEAATLATGVKLDGNILVVPVKYI